MPGGLTYHTGALIAGDRSDRRAWALHRRALERQIVPMVPAGVLAQGLEKPSAGTARSVSEGLPRRRTGGA